MSFGGQVRERFEIWRSFNFGQPLAAEDDDEFLLSRFFLHADFHAREHFRAFVMGKSALVTDRELIGGRRTVDQDEADHQDAFVDLMTTVGNTRLLLRSGRQEMAFGSSVSSVRSTGPTHAAPSTVSSPRRVVERGQSPVS